MKRSLDVRGKYQILQAYMSAYYPALRSVCLSVCLSASISLEPLNRSSRNFLCRSPVAVARSSSCGVAIPWRSLMSMNALLLIAFCCRQKHVDNRWCRMPCYPIYHEANYIQLHCLYFQCTS